MGNAFEQPTQLNYELFLALRQAIEGRKWPERDFIAPDSFDQLVSLGLLTEDKQPTDAGLQAMEPYRVKNALMLAAGMATRFAPISYEIPKGLISVKGEAMIERQIRQLKEVGIDEIIVVVGFMMEKFFYLREKYGVTLVTNPEFTTKNTHSSVYAASNYLGDTYICCSDNYYIENPFHRYEYRAFYCAKYAPGTCHTERALVTNDADLIVRTNRPSHYQWIMWGHAYFDQTFWDLFKPILESYYGQDGVDGMYWENIYDENIEKLPLYINRCNPDELYEFDSMDELRDYDPDFISSNHIRMFENICKTLNCDYSDITDIETLKKGVANRSFGFRCRGEKYVYRHPSANPGTVIDRHREKLALEAAKRVGVDRTLIYIDGDEGWKISSYIENTTELDFNDASQVKELCAALRTLHDARIILGAQFDFWTEAELLMDQVRLLDSTAYRELAEVHTSLVPVHEAMLEDNWPIVMCHNDIYEPNLLMTDSGLNIIDWEYAGDSDIGFDICKLFGPVYAPYETIDNYTEPYFERKTTHAEKLHLLACAAVSYFYWFAWGTRSSYSNPRASSYLMGWYDRMRFYRDEFLKNTRQH